MKKTLAWLLTLFMVLTISTVSVFAADTDVAKIGETGYATIEAAFAAANDGETITLLADAAPVLTSQRAITKASVIDLNGNTLTLTEDDLYFGTIAFKNGNIVVDPSVKPSTAVFWMFANQTLTFDGVKLTATGVTGTYLIGLDGNNSDLNLLNGSEIIIDNTTALDLDVICVNASTGNDIVIEDSKVSVNNLDGRVFFRGNYTVSGASDIDLSGITKAGFRIEAGQTLTIEDTATVDITGEPRDGGIHLVASTSKYTKAETATVNATVEKPAPAGNNFNGYTRGDAIWGEVWGNATESFVIKVLDANDNVMGTTSLNNIGGILNGNVNVTWSIKLDAASNTDEYWTMEWTTAPSLDNMPAKVELLVDGVRVSGGNVVLNGPDDLNKIVAAVADSNGKILSYATSLQAALDAARDGDTIVVNSPDTAISAAGSVYGKTVTITGTAKFDWSQGWLFVGRGGEGDGTLIFDNATIISGSNSSSFGIHVSGRQKDTSNKYDGTLVIKNSNIELDYLINRNNIEVDNSTLTVKNGFGIAGRPANETESGTAATATIDVKNGSTLKVLNHNGMGVGVASSAKEGNGVLNLTDSTFECANFNIDGSLGDFNVYGESVLKIAALTGKEIDLHHNAIIKNSIVGGEVMLYGKVTFRGDNTFAMLYDYGNAYSTEYAEWIVEKGASVTLTDKARYGLGYGDKLTIYGNIEDALAARASLTEDDISVFMHGLVAMSSWDVEHSMTVKDAYVVLGSNNSFGNKPGNYGGTYTFTFDNVVLNSSRITFYSANSKTEFTFNKSDVEVGTFMIRDADSVFTLTDTKLVSTTTTNGADEGNYLAGALVLNNSSLSYAAPLVMENGTLTLDATSSLTARSITGTGKIVIDTTGLTDEDRPVVGNLSGFTGTIEVVGNTDVRASIDEDGNLVLTTPVASIGDVKYYSLQEAIDAVEDGQTIILLKDVTENVVITQKADLDMTIDGANKIFTGVMTVFGNGRQSGAETLTIKNVVFQAVAGKDSCILSPDRSVYNKYSYSHNVTVENCVFHGNTDTPLKAAAVRHNDGGDKNWTIKGCTVDANMHSLLQTNNVAGKLVIDGCTVNSKNGLNLNSCTNVEITNCKINVKGYAVRAGVNSGGNVDEAKTFVLENNTLTTNNSEGDAVIVLRADAAKATVSMEKNSVVGDTHISGVTDTNTVKADENYWSGASEPVVDGTAVKPNSYYTDSDCTDLAYNSLAKIGNTYYATLADAMAAVGAGDVVIELNGDSTLNYPARSAFGTADTTSITINGNGKTLTLHQTDTDWSSIGMANANGKLVLNNMTINKTSAGGNGAWNNHAINFHCDVEMNNVTVNNSVAVHADAVLNNVDIVENGEYYGLWITADGQTVTMNGGSITATNGGRGIKIADQYVDAVESVTLNVTGTTFTTAKKAAILVTSTEGAAITVSNIDISGVAQDKIHAVWMDEDRGEHFDKVTVVGGNVLQEGEFACIVIKNDAILGYYKKLEAAFADASDGDTVVLLDNVNAAVIYAVKKTLTLDLNGYTIESDAAATLTATAGKLTIVDNSAEKTGAIVSNGKKAIDSSASVEILSGKFVGTITTANNQADDSQVSISGGNFSVEPNANLVKHTYIVVPAEDGTYNVISDEYEVIINGNGGKVSGAGFYNCGEVVYISAGTNGNYIFVGWRSDDVVIQNSSDREAYFVMPDHAVTVTAYWASNGAPTPVVPVVTGTLHFETNGGTAIDSLTGVSGRKVDLTQYVPALEGYTFAGWYSDAALTKPVTEITLRGTKTVYAGWIKNATPDVPVVTMPFTDVAADAYYYNAVLWAVNSGITTGMTDTMFGPDLACTRAQVVTFLWRAAGCPVASNDAVPFADVSRDMYYYDAVLWAVEKGITNGISATEFAPDAECSRAQIVTFLWRALGAPDAAADAGFVDVDADAYYATAVEWAVDNGITNGMGDNTFGADADCTRGQTVTFLFRFFCK